MLLRRLVAIGVPAGLQTSMVAFSEAILMVIVNTFGTDVVAGFSAAIRIDQFAFLPALPSSAWAVTALVGQNLGRASRSGYGRSSGLATSG